jgi:glycosyltransferase involved in cell wall biosynthesis
MASPDRNGSAAGRGAVAYVLMAYPRLSETYITSELHRVEQAGVDVRLFVLKPVEPWERGAHQPVVDRVRARPHHLPEVTPLGGVPVLTWLSRNLRPFWPALRRAVGRRPLGVMRAVLAAIAQTLRSREHWYSRPSRAYLKHVLRAVALADALLGDPDIRQMHSHYAHDPTTVAWLASIITGLPFSFTGHARDIYDESRNPAGLLRRKLLAAEFAVTCTQANRRQLEQIAPEATIQRVYHGLGADASGLLDARPAATARNGRLRLLGVGRLVRKKGFDVLVEACGVLARQGVAFEAVIAGPDGEHGDEIRERIAALGLGDRVRLAGPMSQAELCEEYRRADVFCLPCRVLDDDRDGIPNVLVEAMACGAPVVTTGVSGIPELVADGHNGLLVPVGDSEALAGAALLIHEDRELSGRLARRAQETVRERFDGRRSAEELAALFADVRA